MRVHVVIRYIGMVLQFVALFMLASAGVSMLNNYDSAFSPLLLSSFMTSLLGIFPLFFVEKVDEVKTKEGYAIVVGSWLVACIVGMFPYLIWGGEFTMINAWFESVSGFTTTGASILNDIEFLPRGLLFWRSSSAWIGGIGVVMFALVILPSMGKSRHMLSNVEMSTIARDNFHYRSKVIFRLLVTIYVGLTVITTIALKYSGMTWFDAVNHAMTSCGTCGFSTKNNSVAFWDSGVIEGIMMVAMTLSAIHFGVLYATLTGKRNNIFRSDVVRTFILMMLVISVVIAISLVASDVYSNFGEAMRHASFQVVSISTTSGFATTDTNLWTPLAILQYLVDAIFFEDKNSVNIFYGICPEWLQTSAVDIKNLRTPWGKTDVSLRYIEQQCEFVIKTERPIEKKIKVHYFDKEGKDLVKEIEIATTYHKQIL